MAHTSAAEQFRPRSSGGARRRMKTESLLDAAKASVRNGLNINDDFLLTPSSPTRRSCSPRTTTATTSRPSSSRAGSTASSPTSTARRSRAGRGAWRRSAGTRCAARRPASSRRAWSTCAARPASRSRTRCEACSGGRRRRRRCEIRSLRQRRPRTRASASVVPHGKPYLRTAFCRYKVCPTRRGCSGSGTCTARRLKPWYRSGIVTSMLV